MAKFAIKNIEFLGDAVVSLLENADFGYMDFVDGREFILVNTTKQTYKGSDDAKGRTILDPATNWAAVAALVNDNAGGSQEPVRAFTYAVGDQVTMVNKANTKATLVLTPGYVYTVDRVKANSKGQEIIGFAGLPTNEYLASRATKVGASQDSSDVAYTMSQNYGTDAAGNHLFAGDTVLVLTANPGRRDSKFVLPANGVQTITEITAKGNIGFGGADQYRSNRVQKITLSPAVGNVTTGDLVVAKARRDGRFALPADTALVFRGVSVDKGNFILEGYSEDTYCANRFSKITKVGSAA